MYVFSFALVSLFYFIVDYYYFGEGRGSAISYIPSPYLNTNDLVGIGRVI